MTTVLPMRTEPRKDFELSLDEIAREGARRGAAVAGGQVSLRDTAFSPHHRGLKPTATGRRPAGTRLLPTFYTVSKGVRGVCPRYTRCFIHSRKGSVSKAMPSSFGPSVRVHLLRSSRIFGESKP